MIFSGYCDNSRDRPIRGFALIITITLVAMIALIVLGLASISRVEIQGQINEAVASQARANAQLSLQLAVQQLARYATSDEVVTVRSDYLGDAPANANWTGILSKSGSVLIWLVNGPEQGAIRSPYDSVNAATARSSPSVQLLSRALETRARVTVTKSELKNFVPGLGRPAVTGRYAYWVSDESLKVSLGVRTDLSGPSGLAPYPFPRVAKIFSTLTATDAEREKLVTTDQVLLLPGVSADELSQNWSSVTALSKKAAGVGKFTAGAFNVNSRSETAWSAVLGAVDQDKNYSSIISAINSCQHPFTSLDDFSAKLAGALTIDDAGQVASILSTLESVLTTRGDTFLVRAYGEVVDPLASPSDSGYVLAAAFCEAKLQRTLSAVGETRYATTYFRWLGPDDI